MSEAPNHDLQTLMTALGVQLNFQSKGMVCSKLAQARCTRYNIMRSSLSVTCGGSVVFSGFLHQYN
jgi:hypothetical protein